MKVKVTYLDSSEKIFDNVIVCDYLHDGKIFSIKMNGKMADLNTQNIDEIYFIDASTLENNT